MTCQEFWNTNPELGDCEESHLLECPACSARMMRQRELESGFRALAAASRHVKAPYRVELRLQSAFRRQAGTEHRAPSRPWVPAFTWVTAFAAMFALAAFLVRPRQPEVVRQPGPRAIELAAVQQPGDYDGFIPLPNSAGVAVDDDDVNLVRVEVPRSAMIALGLDVSDDRAGELVEADVMLGSNGVARAVRFLE
jgi:hypothetical protein